MPRPIVERYIHLIKNVLGEDICWMVIQSFEDTPTVESVASRIGLQAEQPEMMYPYEVLNALNSDIADFDAGRQLVQFEELASGVAMLQFDGFLGLHAEISGELSRGGRVWVVNWEVNANLEMFHLVDGQAAGFWNPYDSQDEWTDKLGPMARYADMFHAYQFDDDDEVDPLYWRAVPLAVVELDSGVGLDRGWLDRRHATFSLPRGFPFVDPSSLAEYRTL